MKDIEQLIVAASNFVWGAPLLILLLGGGIFFMFYSRFLPFQYFGHAIQIIRGKYDNPDDPGEINHLQALSGALAATIGMGNISGVAVAIATGGPGAIFWMWVSAFFGIATKFFTCTLAVMFRRKDESGNPQGGPMYFIVEGLGEKWRPMAIFFCVAGFLGATPIFQANQMVAVIRESVLMPNGIVDGKSFTVDLIAGLIIASIVALVIFGGIKRIANWAERLVPSMVILYVVSVFIILAANAGSILPSLQLIVVDAFTAEAALGGAVGMIIITGARRAAFSNEAGIGTAPMMHGAAKTKEPVREGLVAMMGPAIDTLLVCTMTGLAILITGQWQGSAKNGIALTAAAFNDVMPGYGPYILTLCVVIFAFTTIFSLSYYGRKCTAFMFGERSGHYFNMWYVFLVVIGSVATLQAVVSFIDMAYGLMAFPTMIGAVLLAPKVRAAYTSYFSRLKKGEFTPHSKN